MTTMGLTYKKAEPYLGLLFLASVWLLSLAGFYTSALVIFRLVANTRLEGLFKDLLFTISDGLSALIVFVWIWFLFPKKAYPKIQSVLTPKPSLVLTMLSVGAAVALLLIMLNRYLGLEISHLRGSGEPAILTALWRQGTITSRMGIGFMLAKIFILMPLCEEIVFRFCLLETVGRDFGKRWGAVISSLVYAALISSVLDPPGFLFIFGIGLTFSFLYFRYRNLWPSFLLNGAVKSSVFYMVLFMR